MRSSTRWLSLPFVLAAFCTSCGLFGGREEWGQLLPIDEGTEGYAYGVSAPFIGRLPEGAGGGIVVAGGCNFPDTPAAEGGKKRYYADIFRFDTATYAWRAIGRLGQPLAYGASASSPEGVICAGGTDTLGHPTDGTFLLTGDGIRRLAPLPVAMDNCAGAYLDGRFYVAGDTVFCIYDFATDSWRRGPRWPGGGRRVQPVAVAQAGRVWLFGGYDPAGPEFVAGEGCVYDPATDQWEAVPGPVDENGLPLLAAGGAGVAWGNDSIVCFGGVNAAVFTAALQRGQALAQRPGDDSLRQAQREYMEQEPAWYRFNDRTLIFNTTTRRWSLSDVAASESARAGAGATTFGGGNGGGGVVLFNGEVKPGIRTPEVWLWRP